MPEQQRGVGRPTRYRRALCDTLPSMFENGESVAEVCAELGITRTTFYKWVDKHSDFATAYDHGKQLSEAWWTRLGRFGAAGVTRHANATMWIFNMKNRFGWRDRQAGEDAIGELTPEEFARRTSAALAEMEAADHGGTSVTR